MKLKKIDGELYVDTPPRKVVVVFDDQVDENTPDDAVIIRRIK